MYSFGIIMNPIETTNMSTDSTVAIVEALQKNSKVYYIFPDTICIDDQKVYGKVALLSINRNKVPFYKVINPSQKDLSKLDCILFRLDPPVNEYYIQLTHILDKLESAGVLVINSPQSLRDFNEKMLGECLTNKSIPTLITSNKNYIRKFLKKHKKIVIKPINMMGGRDIISLSLNNKGNEKLIDEALSSQDNYVVCQKFINEIIHGDTRILITNGIVHEDVLVRFPPKNDFRANLSFGGKYKVKKINKKYLSHLKEVAIYLKHNRIYFAGIDMIGDHITEINITSPTGIKQIEEKNKKISLEVASQFIDIVKKYYDKKK